MQRFIQFVGNKAQVKSLFKGVTGYPAKTF
jgi:hypothetical protein